MKTSNFAALLTVTCLVPAFAHADPGDNPGLGAAGFESTNSVLVFSALDNVVGQQILRRIDLATGSSSSIVTLSVSEPYDEPSFTVAPGADRGILFDRSGLAQQPVAPWLFDVTASGAASVIANTTVSNAQLVAAFGPTGRPFVLLGLQPDQGSTVAEILEGPATAGGSWSTIASSDSSEIVGCQLALVVDSADNPVGFCDASPISVGAGGALVLGAPSIQGQVGAISGVKSAAGPVFYAAVTDSNPNFEDIDQVTLGTAGNWTWTTLAQLTAYPQQVVAMDESNVAVVANGIITVYTNAGSTWTSVVAGPVESSFDAVSAFGPNRLLAASYDVTVYSNNGAQGWSANNLGPIGIGYGFGTGARGGMVCTLAPAVTLLTPAMLVWLLPPVLLMLRRRSGSAR